MHRIIGMLRSHSPITRQEAEMMNRVKHQVHEASDSLEKLRLLCLSRGATGILRLGRFFRRMDHHGNKHIYLEEFKHGIAELGLELSESEVEDLFKRFDTEKKGYIDMTEFLIQLRPPMSESRMKDIEAAFNKLDEHSHGEITIDDLRCVYDVKSNSLYMSGEVSKEQFLTKFINNFEQDAIKDGKITKEEFFNYYSGISASTESDAYFDLVIRHAYKL